MAASVASYHVFIERPRDPGGPAVARLAEAVAERYGLPAAQLTERLASGRLRVKAGVDRATAETFATDLERLGAVCSIVDSATGASLVKPAPEPVPKPVPKPVPEPTPPRAQTPSPYASGLSAASAPQVAQDLGALASSDFALSTLDGKNDVDPDGLSGDALAASFGPPADAEALPASIGPAITPVAAPAARGRSSSSVPLDLFAPPDAAGEAELALDVDTRDRRGGTTAPELPTAPPPGTVAAEPAPSAPSTGGLAGWLRDRRLRLASGVAVAILLGFVPATVVASLRESSDFQRIDAEVTLHYKGVKTAADYRKLDPWLATQRATKRDVQRSIALGSMLIWALAGAVVAFVWFRKIDWDRVADRFAS